MLETTRRLLQKLTKIKICGACISHVVTFQSRIENFKAWLRIPQIKLVWKIFNLMFNIPNTNRKNQNKIPDQIFLTIKIERHSHFIPILFGFCIMSGATWNMETPQKCWKGSFRKFLIILTEWKTSEAVMYDLNKVPMWAVCCLQVRRGVNVGL